MLIPFDQLFARHKIKATGVLHLGAHLGQEAEAYAAQGIRNVVWVEALPDIHMRLRKNVSNYPGHITFQACLSDKDDEEVVFRVASNEGQSSSYLEFGTHSTEHPSVVFTNSLKLKTSRLDTLLFRNGIALGERWFLNVDLQGAELKALRGMGGMLYRFDHAYIEVNERELYKGCPLVQEIDRYLGCFGFVGKETKMTNHGWGDKYYKREISCSRP